MSNYGYTHRVVALDGASANSSVRTSPSILVRDATNISLSITSVAAVASVWSIDGSNSDGFTSVLTVGTAPSVDL